MNGRQEHCFLIRSKIVRIKKHADEDLTVRSQLNVSLQWGSQNCENWVRTANKQIKLYDGAYLGCERRSSQRAIVSFLTATYTFSRASLGACRLQTKLLLADTKGRQHGTHFFLRQWLLAVEGARRVQDDKEYCNIMKQCNKKPQRVSGK